jgi:hypothetical protein
MPPERPGLGTPADWLRHARSDLALAQVRVSADILRSGRGLGRSRSDTGCTGARREQP